MKSIWLLNGCLLLTMLWSYGLTARAGEQFDRTVNAKTSCQSIASKIILAREKSLRIGFAPINYDCSREVMKLVGVQGVALPRSISSRDSSVEDGFAIKSVDNPFGVPVTLQQLVGVIDSGHKNDVCYFTEGLRISRAKDRNNAGEMEQWVVEDFRFKFLSEKLE